MNTKTNKLTNLFFVSLITLSAMFMACCGSDDAMCIAAKVDETYNKAQGK